MFLARHSVAIGLLATLAATAWLTDDANAQQIFRSVGPDGRVTFSDKPPMEAQGKGPATQVVRLNSQGASTIQLPFELRQPVERYPVVLYTAQGCGPCEGARAMLSGRGILFTEKTVSSNEDIQALLRMSGSSSVPFLTIGGQQLKGFAEVEWTQFLDAAGYPKTSQLPAGYTQAPATPLVSADAATAARPAPAQAAAAAGQASASQDASEAPEENSENPTGIRF